MHRGELVSARRAVRTIARYIALCDAVTLRPAVAALPILILGVPLWATWNGDAVTALLKVTSTVVLLASAVRPRYGLMLVAALLPLATQIQVLSGSPFSGAETAELILVPFLFAATLRTALSAPAQPTRLGWPALLLATTALASAIVELFLTAGPPLLPTLADHYNRTYYSDPASFGNLRSAIRWTEGLLLAVIAERTLRQDPTAREAVTRLLIVGALAAAAFAALRLSEVSIRTLEPWSTAYRYLRTLRINPHYGDANAAGSFYVLFLAPAVWLAWQRGWRWLLPLLPIGLLALSMTGSRAAIGAGVIGVAAAWAAYRRPRPRVLILGSQPDAARLDRARQPVQPESRRAFDRGGHPRGTRHDRPATGGRTPALRRRDRAVQVRIGCADHAAVRRTLPGRRAWRERPQPVRADCGRARDGRLLRVRLAARHSRARPGRRDRDDTGRGWTDGDGLRPARVPARPA